MTLNIDDTTNEEEVVRRTQLGVRFPDGSILWGQSDNNRRTTVSYDGSDWIIDPSYDNRSSYNTFTGMEARFLRKLTDIKMVADETSLLERVSREVVVLFGKITVKS